MSNDFMEPGGEDDAVVKDFTPIKLPDIETGTAPIPALREPWTGEVEVFEAYPLQEVLPPEEEESVQALYLNRPPESIMLKLPPDKLEPGDIIRMSQEQHGLRWQVIDKVEWGDTETKIFFTRPNGEDGAATLLNEVHLEIARPTSVMQVPHASGSLLRRFWTAIKEKTWPSTTQD